MMPQASTLSYQTASTRTSTIDRYSITSSSDIPANSTALTTPDLSSPKKNGGRLEPILSVLEGGSQVDEPPSAKTDTMAHVIRGPSVKERASRFEHFGNQAEASSSRLPTVGMVPERTRSTSPLRVNRLPPAPHTPAAQRRVPVPATAPPTANDYEAVILRSVSKRRSPTQLSRGTTKRMVQQWESLPSTPARPRHRIVSATLSREHLDKPLPSPGAGPSSAYSTPGRSYPISPYNNRSPYAPSPLQHLQTPRHASIGMSKSPSSWSLSPGGEQKKKGGRSPLKEMLNVFGGGILRKGRRNKEKDKDIWKQDYASSVSEGLERMGSNGLPGGIVFHDRMGDQEMAIAAGADPNVIRTSAMIYLIPTPCSSVSPWGSWLTSWGSLTSTQLKITYCPIFQDPQNGHNTPKRVFSSGSGKSADPAFAFSAIPLPEAGVIPDVELSMKDCVEVRSLRREEVKGRGVPQIPQGVGTEVLEMVWSDGSKRYIGVEGVAGRLGWVSAIWDVLLACKSQGMAPLPPPSPTHSPRPSVTAIQPSPLAIPSRPYQDDLDLPRNSMSPRSRQASGSTLKASRGNSSVPPIQKVGDRWIASGAIASSEVGSTRQYDPPSDDLRDSVQRMFETGPDTTNDLAFNRLPTPVEGSVTERVLAWQPATERDLSIFSRNGSKRSGVSAKGATFSEVDRTNGFPKAETALSFDINDLNPSRSASQVKRNYEPGNQRLAARNELEAVPEVNSAVDRTTVLPDPTHISHVTFPKPSLGSLPRAPVPLGAKVGALEMIPSGTNSSVESDGQTLRTPSNETAYTAATSIDHAILSKLESHTTEHGSLAKQVDNVHVDLRQVIFSLAGLVSATKRSEEEPIGKALDDRLSTIQMDVKAIENALNLSNLSTNRLSMAEMPAEPKLVEVHTKLDAIAKLCQEVLARDTSSANEKADKGALMKSPKPGAPSGKLGIVVDTEEEKKAGDEVAQIMAELTGGSSKTSPRLGGLQVLHNISNPSSPHNSAPTSPVIGAPLSDDTRQQVGEVLNLVKELKDARTLQTQQTTDIARYLNELNTWLEKFVLNSTNEISSMSKRLTAIVGSDPDVPAENGQKTIGMPDLVADMHSILSDQKQRHETEGSVAQRLDSLLQMMGQDRERQASQQGMVEQVMGIVERQRSDNEVLLRALATDLTSEIRGERLRFVEAMQQATTMNISAHVEEFKKTLSAEVGKAMKELGQLREERKALEHQISDLFALKAKHGGRDSRKASAAAPPPPPPSSVGTTLAPPSPGYGMRGLPLPPPGR